MGKKILLFILAIVFFFSISLKSNAAELYTANITFGLCQYDNGSFSGIYAGIGGTYTLTSNNPIYVYWYNPYEVPTNASGQEGQVFIITKGTLNGLSGVSTCTYNGETYSFYNTRTSFGGSSVSTCAFFFTAFGNGAEIRRLNKIYNTSNIQDIISWHLGNELDYRVNIDWDNMQYNETIDYLQNVMLKSTDFKERNFEITWSNNNGQYMSDEWHVQIGWNTKFQKELFGDVYNWTNLEYVTWLDNLKYSEGKWTGNFDTMYSEIPECNYRSWWGSIYLRLVRVDSNTGSVEYGGWGQLSWAHKDDYGLTANYKTIKYANSLDKPGVSESESYQYIEDTEHKSSQSYVINTGNGTIDSVSTSVTNGILDETGSIDLEKATNYFVSGIDGLLSVVDNFPRFIGKVFSFLPSEIVTIFTIGLVIALVCRLGGR